MVKLEEALAGIVKYRELIHKQSLWTDPNGLSEAVVKLSVYNSYLADHLASLHKTSTDTSYKAFTEAVAAGEPVTKAQTKAKGESVFDRQIYENVKNIYTATNNLISVIQTRIRVIENGIKQEGSIS